jgi:hypothetical protein
MPPRVGIITEEAAMPRRDERLELLLRVVVIRPCRGITAESFELEPFVDRRAAIELGWE